MFRKNIYAAWNHNELLGVETDYPTLRSQFSEGSGVVLIEYEPDSMTVLGRVTL